MHARKISEKIAAEFNPVRQKKVEKIKARVSSGKYRVSAWELAKALVLSQ